MGEERTGTMLATTRRPASLLGAVVVLLACCPAATLAEESRSIYSLHHNRVHAHLDQGGLVLDAGSPGFVRYLRGNFGQSWAVDRKLDGQRTTLVSGRQGVLHLPLSSRQASATRVEIRMKGLAPRQRVTLFLNKKKLGDIEVQGSWHTGSREIPSGLLKAGENRLRLTFRKSVKTLGTRTSAALRWIRLALPGASELPESGPELALARGDALRIPSNGGLAFYLMPPKGSSLMLAASPEPGSTGCVLKIVSQQEGKPPTTLARREVTARGSRLDVALAVRGGLPLRLELLETGGPACRGLLLDGARLEAPGSAGGGEVPKARPKQVIFWMIDALRADRLDVYRKSRVKTPNLDQIVAQGTTFMRYSVEGNESKVSHASFFTGVYPVVHRVLGEKAKLPDRLVTIAEAMAAGGLRTAGLVSNGYVSDRWNYHQGFGTYRNYIREEVANDAKAVYGHAVSWLDRYASRGPFYLYLGTIDPHVTYRAHKGILELYDSKPYKGKFRRYLSGVELGKIKGGRLRVSERDKLRIEALYDNEVTYNDQYLGELLKYLRDKEMLDDTLLIITGDHGDEFWDHGRCGHGSGVYQELVWVPLVLRYPKLFPAGRKVMVEADGVDILPTLLDAMDISVPSMVQGESLLPRVHESGIIYPRSSISTHYDQVYALRSGEWKVILHKGGRTQVYDLAKDPGEQRDLARERPIARRFLMDALSLFLANQKRWKKTRWGVPTNLAPGFTLDLRVP